jgi:hypothetical protein
MDIISNGTHNVSQDTFTSDLKYSDPTIASKVKHQ